MDLGFCFPRELPPSLLAEFARRLDASDLDELWVIEDCFYTAGISLAATALACTERLHVGIGILPAVARNTAITAMELATLANLAPGRLIGGIGHGVQEWMEQIGARPDSPVTALGEVLVAVRRLLAGERVTTAGRYVALHDVALDQPPIDPPLILAGVRGPRSLVLAGRCADGVVLTELTGPTAVAAAVHDADPAGDFRVCVYTAVRIDDDRAAARRSIAPWIAEMVATNHTGLRAAPFFDELEALVQRDGADGLVAAPDDWWRELGAVGTPDDAADHVAALAAAGAHAVALFPPPDADGARIQLDRAVAAAPTLRGAR